MTHDTTYSLWIDMVKGIPSWEFAVVGFSVSCALLLLLFYDIGWMQKLGIFHAFEKIKIKRKDLERTAHDSTYIEITIPRDSQATAFQIQQKILAVQN